MRRVVACGMRRVSMTRGWDFLSNTHVLMKEGGRYMRTLTFSHSTVIEKSAVLGEVSMKSLAGFGRARTAVTAQRIDTMYDCRRAILKRRVKYLLWGRYVLGQDRTK